jgi:hypothetical protein
MISRRSPAYSSATCRARSVRVGYAFSSVRFGLTVICNPNVTLDQNHASSLRAGQGAASLAAAGAVMDEVCAHRMRKAGQN